jgi:hypothetical protein
MEVSMLRKLRSRLTYANVVSTIALVLAVGGGTAYAATRIGTDNIRYHAVTGSKLSTNAVTASKVKNSALSGTDIRDNSIRGIDVRTGTLEASDFAPGQLPKGDPATSIFAAVSAAGVLGANKNVTNLSSTDAGAYTVTINQDVSKCAAVATLAGGAAGTVTAEPTAGNVQQFTFQTRSGPTDERRAFQFAIYC